jgi:hypothetical protein
MGFALSMIAERDWLTSTSLHAQPFGALEGRSAVIS